MEGDLEEPLGRAQQLGMGVVRLCLFLPRVIDVKIRAMFVRGIRRDARLAARAARQYLKAGGKPLGPAPTNEQKARLRERIGYALGRTLPLDAAPADPSQKRRRGRPRTQYDSRGQPLTTMDGWFSWMLPVRR